MIKHNVLYKFLIVFLNLLIVSNVHSLEIFDNSGDIPICEDILGCSYQKGLTMVKSLIEGVIVNKTLSEYVQDIVVYLLSFISIVAVIYIIYAGFLIMISGGNEQNVKKSKKMIINIIIGIIIIWLSYSIVIFFINIL